MIDDAALIQKLRHLGEDDFLPIETKEKVMSTISLAKFLLEVADLFVLKKTSIEIEMLGELFASGSGLQSDNGTKTQ